MELRETEWYGIDWIDVVQDREHWKACVAKVINFAFCKAFKKLSSITITLFVIIHHLVSYLKHYVLGNGFCLHLQVGPIQMGPKERANHCLWTPTTKSVRFLKPTQHKPPAPHTWGLTSFMHANIGPSVCVEIQHVKTLSLCRFPL
jgi:hypothetical protein